MWARPECMGNNASLGNSGCPRQRTAGGCAGELHYLAPMKRSESGAIVSLCVYTEEGISILESEYDVREFLAPEGLVVEERTGQR